MKSRYILTTLFTALIAVNAIALTGRWRGDLVMGSAKLPLVFNFQTDAGGAVKATMDSPMQNSKDIPLDILFLSADSVSVECKRLGAMYSGRIDGENMIEGTFAQRGIRLPLTLTRERPLSERRPQTPMPPFPYTERDTTFISADGTELAGTLTIPDAGAGMKCPVVVMVTGSGPQNRDEEIFEHRPFAVIADYLARNGIASLRYDDRGIASSKGSYPAATIDSFRTDAHSALRFVRETGMFGKAGILGHSEGGTLAVLIAASEEDAPDFIISLAGMVVPAKETLLAQNRRALDRYPFSDKQKESAMTLIATLYDNIITQTREGVSSPVDIDQICKEASLDVPAAVLESVKHNNLTRNAYFDSLLSLDPTGSLTEIKCPVMAINGTKDTQVDAEANLEAFRRNVKDVEIWKMEGLNHLMQHAATGDSSEYGEITETISPDVLQLIGRFINQR